MVSRDETVTSTSEEDYMEGIESQESEDRNRNGKDFFEAAPVGEQSDTIPATAFSLPYRSVFTIPDKGTGKQPLPRSFMKCLAHVNCSYLSTQGRAPTLLELKQHAQSLAVLIKEITVSTKGGIVDNRNTIRLPDAVFNENESFDWLNNLNKPYTNNDRHHTDMPLTSLMNTIEADSNAALGHMQYDDNNNVRNICPLYTCHSEKQNHPLGDKRISQPYAVRQNLFNHANEILEYLDHEYSSKGGLTAIVPTTKEDPKQRALAETTLLGQFILYNQRLVQRLHDIERLYADSMDVLKGEAAAPHQILSRLGPDGRKPRDVVYPQDRFVLVNAGEDVWQFLHSEFSRKEIADVRLDEQARQDGVTGQQLWEGSGGREFAKGITAIDVMTRFYRLRNDPLKTVFVIPAYQAHPGTKVTREFQKQPTVVSVVKPLWPERISAWEQRRRKEIHDLKEFQRLHDNCEYTKESFEHRIMAVTADRDIYKERFRELQMQTGKPTAKHANLEWTKKATALKKEQDEATATKVKYDNLYSEYLEKTTQAESDKKKAADLLESSQDSIARKEAELKAKEARIHALDLDTGRSAQETAEKLKRVWEKQIYETVQLNLYLQSKVPAGETIPGHIKDQAKVLAKKMVDQATAAM